MEDEREDGRARVFLLITVRCAASSTEVRNKACNDNLRKIYIVEIHRIARMRYNGALVTIRGILVDPACHRDKGWHALESIQTCCSLPSRGNISILHKTARSSPANVLKRHHSYMPTRRAIAAERGEGRSHNDAIPRGLPTTHALSPSNIEHGCEDPSITSVPIHKRRHSCIRRRCCRGTQSTARTGPCRRAFNSIQGTHAAGDGHLGSC